MGLYVQESGIGVTCYNCCAILDAAPPSWMEEESPYLLSQQGSIVPAEEFG